MHTGFPRFCASATGLLVHTESPCFRVRRAQLPGRFETMACVPTTFLTVLLAEATVGDDMGAVGQPNSAIQLSWPDPNDSYLCCSFACVCLVPGAMSGWERVTPIRCPDGLIADQICIVRLLAECVLIILFGDLIMDLIDWIIDLVEDLLPLIEIAMEG